MPLPVVAAGLIGVLVAAFSRLIASRIGQWVITAFVFMGLALGTQEAIMDPLLSLVSSQFTGLPAALAEWLGVLNIDRYVTIVLSAYVVALGKRVVLQRRSASA